MVELVLPTPGHVQDIPIQFDVVHVNKSVLLCLYVLDENSLFIDNVTGHLWNHVILRESP